MLTLEPIHMQIAGVAILALIGFAFVFWMVRATIETKRGRALYLLGDAEHHDGHGEDDEGLDVR